MASSDTDPLVGQDAARSGTGPAPEPGNIRTLRPGDIVITPCLRSRPTRPTAITAEAEALHAIGGLIGHDPGGAVDALLEAVRRLCGCGSAGFSLIANSTDGQANLRWSGIAGPLARHTGTTVPRDAGPSGLCLDADATVLVSRPFAALARLGQAEAPLLEGLLTPLRDTGGTQLGTLWAVHHDVTLRFDAEDARVLEQFSALLVLALKAMPEAARGPAPTLAPAAQPVSDAEADENPFVRKLHAFVPLPAVDRATLHRLTLDAVTVPARTDLIRKGDAPGGVFLMLDGMACRYREVAAGRRQVTAFLLPGDFCDLDVALLTRMDHTIMTLTAGRVARLDRDTVLDLTRNHPNIAAALRKTTLVDEATLREWLVNLASRSGLERIAHLLCELQARIDVVSLTQAGGAPLPVSQRDLCDATGLSGVHVNRALQDLRRQGLITLEDGAPRVADPEGLRELSGFTGEYLHLEERGPRA